MKNTPDEAAARFSVFWSQKAAWSLKLYKGVPLALERRLHLLCHTSSLHTA